MSRVLANQAGNFNYVVSGMIASVVLDTPDTIRVGVHAQSMRRDNYKSDGSSPSWKVSTVLTFVPSADCRRQSQSNSHSCCRHESSADRLSVEITATSTFLDHFRKDSEK